MSNIPTRFDNPNGLHGRYYIQKILFDEYDNYSGTKEVDDDAEYFVMRLDEGGKDREHIKACRIGVRAYADVIEHHLPKLAKDLRERYPLLK